ncbi:hypothetical protein [Burkholderia sp. Ac-20379]|uniref:hypothetical protein n=1 Tax=Burkholderia sp. Ac-20379 TaxID=2703900 RepID=UPI001F120521|nr:hypothetical protein [Burkholderia sp. Ac-20379]
MPSTPIEQSANTAARRRNARRLGDGSGRREERIGGKAGGKTGGEDDGEDDGEAGGKTGMTANPKYDESMRARTAALTRPGDSRDRAARGETTVAHKLIAAKPSFRIVANQAIAPMLCAPQT